jgi:hypothetical protein
MFGEHPLAPDVPDRLPKRKKGFGARDMERSLSRLFDAVLHSEEQRDDVDGMVRVEVRKEDAVYRKGVKSRR